jgi:hypothetical protein
MTRTIPRGSPPRCGHTSGPLSAPGSRARLSRRSLRTRRTPLTHPRRGAAVTVTDEGDGNDRGNGDGDGDGGKGDDKGGSGNSKASGKAPLA